MSLEHSIHLWHFGRHKLRDNSPTLMMFAKLVTQIFSSMIQSQILDFSCYDDFYFMLKFFEPLQIFFRLLSHQIDLSIHSNHRRKFMKQKNPPRAATYNGPYTSTCIISIKLVTRSILAYERSFSHLQISPTSVKRFKIK